MELIVRRKLIPLDSRDGWERRKYDRIIYFYDSLTGQERFMPDKVPDGYIYGLLVCDIDGHQVDVGRFDVALKEVGIATTRRDILKATARQEGSDARDET